MNKKYIVAANWKMNRKFNETIEFCTKNLEPLVDISQHKLINLVICPSFISIYPLCNIFKETKVNIGGQDCSNYTKGSFTGQVSAKSLHEAGCNYCIIGHSETRKYKCDTDKEIAQKFVHLIDFDISPILCVGENKEEYEAGKAISVIEKQLVNIFTILNTARISEYLTPCIAYEPIWSIGTGKIPSEDHLHSIFAWLSNKLASLKTHAKLKFLYGGSLDENNVENFKSIKQIDGFLIGGASLDIKKLEKITKKLTS